MLCLLILLLQYYGLILFQISRNVPVPMKLLKIADRGLTRDLLHNLIIRTDVSRCLCALIMLRALRIFNITSLLKKNEGKPGV